MKRLRKKYGKGIRYYHCGEYGEQFNRPHYHACIFGFSFPDKVPWKEVNSYQLYTSEELQKLWPFGHSTIGNFDFQTAAYCARYTIKKVYGKNASNHYQRIDPITGEVHPIQPEYSTMSRRPGIGASWLKKYASDVYPKGRVVLRERELKAPKFYDKIYLENASPEILEAIKFHRQEKAKNSLDNSEERLKTRLAVIEFNLKQLKRSYES